MKTLNGMPTELTAENGAKALLMGEFSETVVVSCPHCEDGLVDDEACTECGGEGEGLIKVPVGWDTIKNIYKMITDNMVVPTDDDINNKLNAANDEIDLLRKETNIGDPSGDIYVVATERDHYEPLKSRGAMAMETMLGEANLCNAVDAALRMTRYGNPTICKLLPVGSLEYCQHIINSPCLDDDALCKHLPSVFDRKQMEDHPQFDEFIRAFWRRVYPYVNDYERELPEEMPTPLKCSMATALMVFDMEVRG